MNGSDKSRHDQESHSYTAGVAQSRANSTYVSEPYSKIHKKYILMNSVML